METVALISVILATLIFGNLLMGFFEFKSDDSPDKDSDEKEGFIKVFVSVIALLIVSAVQQIIILFLI